MTETTPEIDAIIDQLATLCLEAVQAEQSLNRDRMDALTLALATNGWSRRAAEHEPLSVVLRSEIEKRAPDTLKHAELMEGVLTQVQKSYQRQQRFQTSVPSEQRSPREQGAQQTSPPLTTLHVRDHHE